MTKEEKQIGIVMGVIICVLIVFVAFAVTSISTSWSKLEPDVRERGLKGILEDVWCGEKGCDNVKK